MTAAASLSQPQHHIACATTYFGCCCDAAHAFAALITSAMPEYHQCRLWSSPAHGMTLRLVRQCAGRLQWMGLSSAAGSCALDMLSPRRAPHESARTHSLLAISYGQQQYFYEHFWGQKICWVDGAMTTPVEVLWGSAPGVMRVISFQQVQPAQHLKKVISENVAEP